MIAIRFIGLDGAPQTWLAGTTAWGKGGTGQLTPRLLQFHVLVINRIVINPSIRGRNPPGHLAWLKNTLHQTVHESAVSLIRKPITLARLELRPTDRPSTRVSRNPRPTPD